MRVRRWAGPCLSSYLDKPSSLRTQLRNVSSWPQKFPQPVKAERIGLVFSKTQLLPGVLSRARVYNMNLNTRKSFAGEIRIICN